MARFAACALLFVAAHPVVGQPPTVVPRPAPAPNPPLAPPTTPTPPDDELTVREATVGYIDSPAIADQVRLRSDFGYDFREPNRAEFFYARGKARGPGLPRGERAIDFQDHMLYLEKTVAPGWSVFAEGGVRALNPDLNANAIGIGDTNLGFKYAFLQSASSLYTWQLRTYLPSGAASRGLGNRHVSVEPALLGFTQLTDQLGLASELRYWQPIGGTDFASGVVRYGLGLRYALWDGFGCRVSPTAEVIGWSVLGGHESRLEPDGSAPTRDSAGTTIVNVKLGARVDFGERAGLYAGYGRAITGERWYRDVFRIEFRWLY